MLSEWSSICVSARLTRGSSRKVVFVDTDCLPARELKRGSLIENEVEGSLIFQVSPLPSSTSSILTPSTQIAHALVKCGIKQDDIGVIALYRQQIKLISRLLHPYPDIEVLTADKSQGRDKDCILMSLTRSNAAGQARPSLLSLL
jgi:DNA replication ATP-dependent helicase Dna2